VPLHEIMWKNIAEQCRSHMTTRSMRVPHWITKITYALTICNIYLSSTVTMDPRRRLNFALYVQCLSCYYRVLISP